MYILHAKDGLNSVMPESLLGWSPQVFQLIVALFITSFKVEVNRRMPPTKLNAP